MKPHDPVCHLPSRPRARYRDGIRPGRPAVGVLASGRDTRGTGREDDRKRVAGDAEKRAGCEFLWELAYLERLTLVFFIFVV